MNRRDYTIYMLGYHEAARGAGLSDSPYGGTDGFLWRRGVATWLDEHGKARSRLDPYQDTPPKPGKGRKVRK